MILHVPKYKINFVRIFRNETFLKDTLCLVTNYVKYLLQKELTKQNIRNANFETRMKYQ